jgi:hypothetical protein
VYLLPDRPDDPSRDALLNQLAHFDLAKLDVLSEPDLGHSCR